MIETQNCVYPGRFQPMTKGHLAIVERICNQYQVSRLVLAIPEQEDRNVYNPFSSFEANKIARLSLDEAGYGWVETQIVTLDMGLAEAWKRNLLSNEVDLVVTGNQNMAAIIDKIAFFMGKKTRAVYLEDGCTTNIRASDVREGIFQRRHEWRQFVTASAANYIDSLDISWNSLPSGRRKRNWSI